MPTGGGGLTETGGGASVVDVTSGGHAGTSSNASAGDSSTNSAAGESGHGGDRAEPESATTSLVGGRHGPAAHRDAHRHPALSDVHSSLTRNTESPIALIGGGASAFDSALLVTAAN